MNIRKRIGVALLGALLLCLPLALFGSRRASGQATLGLRQMERLGRGVVAIKKSAAETFVSWRVVASDPELVAFNLYRKSGNNALKRLNTSPITGATWFSDTSAPEDVANAYFVRVVTEGKEGESSRPFTIAANAPAHPYLSIPLQTPPGYTPNDIAVGDLDGDGEYEIVVKQEQTPHDNSQNGLTGQSKLEAYKLDGKLLWRIDLGINIREGAHYTPFLVYDFDGDGRAEIAVRTSVGTIDGAGNKIPPPPGGKLDYRNMETGRILEGPEYLSVFDGRNGKEIARTDYIPRGKVTDWGDAYGNRCDRFLMAVAYVDGVHPSIITCRGYYTITKLEAWNWRGGKLSRVWAFSSGDLGNEKFAGQGNHNLGVADVDGDGRDDIIYGAMTVSGTGKGMYSTGLGHGDALHVSDLDPDRPGLEVLDIQERFDDAGINFRDARTGEVLWKKPSLHPDKGNQGPGRGLALDVDPRHRGFECWARGSGMAGIYDCKGNLISDVAPPSCNMGIYWDGDTLSELLDGTTISKWNPDMNATTLLQAKDYNCLSNNGTKANPCLSADILGDWREEVIWRTADNRELRLFTTTIPTNLRFTTLMHDPIYRLGIAWQNVGYNQPPHLGYYFGDGMGKPPRYTFAYPSARGEAKTAAK